jgi:hypothetical protein
MELPIKKCVKFLAVEKMLGFLDKLNPRVIVGLDSFAGWLKELH